MQLELKKAAGGNPPAALSYLLRVQRYFSRTILRVAVKSPALIR